MATERECLGAAKAAAAYAGLGEVRRVKAVDADATTVPYGCSYSHVTKAAVYNRNPMGACPSATDCLYESVCVVDESSNAAAAAAQAEAKAKAAEEEAKARAEAETAAEAFMEAEKAFVKKLAQALVARRAPVARAAARPPVARAPAGPAAARAARARRRPGSSAGPAAAPARRPG